MNGTGGGVSVPPKPAPKPAAKPKGKKPPPPLLKSASDQALLSPKPLLSASPARQGPQVSPKPKFGGPLAVSPKPKGSPPVPSPRPRSNSKPQVLAPSDDNPSSHLANGGPLTNVPKPAKPTPARRKSLGPLPSPSTWESTIPGNSQCVTPEQLVDSHQRPSSSPQESPSPAPRREGERDSSSIQTYQPLSNNERETTVKQENSDQTVIENPENQEQSDKPISVQEPSESIPQDHAIVESDVNALEENQENALEENRELATDRQIPLVNNKDEDSESNHDVSATDCDDVTEDTVEAVASTGVSDQEEVPEDLSQSLDSTEPYPFSAPASATEKPPEPAPRNSVSSVASVNSSIDSYDLLNARSSFKSHRSGSSVRSEASSRLGSDSEEECGVFEINDSIAEEVEEESHAEEPVQVTIETLETETESESPDSEEAEFVSKESLATNPQEEDHRVNSDHQTSDGLSAEVHIAADDHDDDDVHLVTVGADTAQDKDTDQAKDTFPEVITQLSPGEILESDATEPANGCVEETVAVEPELQEQHCGTQKEPCDEINDESVGGHLTVNSGKYSVPNFESDNALVSSSGGETAITRPISSASQLSGICGEYHLAEDSEEARKAENNPAEDSSEEDTTESDQEEEEEVSEEDEEEVDEMGKRVFSLSRKKKSGVLKYSSGEFHEQYEGTGKEKSSPDKGKSKQKKKQKKAKREEEEKKSSLSNFKPDLTENCGDAVEPPSDEEQTIGPPRMGPEGLSGAAAVSSGPRGAGDQEAQSSRPFPAPRLSLDRPMPSPRASARDRIASDSEGEDTHGLSSTTPTQTSDFSQDEGDQAMGSADDVFMADHPACCVGGAGAVVTRLDTDGEEEVIIGGGMPCSSTQTAFMDQASINSSSAEVSVVEESASEAADPRRDDNAPRQFRHYAAIEPVNGAMHDAPQVAGATAAASPLPVSAATSLSENQSITISVTGSEEPFSDSTEQLSHGSEYAVNKPWSEVAAVTVAVSTMPEPLVPEYTNVVDDSTSTTSSCASSLVTGKAAERQDEISDDLASDGQLYDGEDADDNDNESEGKEGRNMYDQVEIYDESYKKKDWLYIDPKEAQPIPETEEEKEEAKDTVSQLSESSSLATTASEVEFRASFGVRPHRIQRRRGTEDYVRLSRISRERAIKLNRRDGTFGLRIQKSRPVVVTNLDKDGPAEKAGLRVGDMILTVNGVDVRNARHSEVVKLATEAPEPLSLIVGTVVCNSLNIGDDKIVMSGYMHKLASTGMIKQWRKRWFVLKHDNCLYYYKTETDVVPQGAIVLQNYAVTKARDSGKPFCFKLTKEGARTYFFYTSDDEEMSSWGKAISEAASPNNHSDIWMDISTHNVSLPALSLKDPECQGYINKFNSRMRNQRRRYCVLKDACLYYYKDMSAMSAQGVVHLHGYNIQETELKGKKYAFILKPPEEDLREFYFFANHETDRKRWVSALASSIGRWVQTNTTDDGDDDGTEMLI